MYTPPQRPPLFTETSTGMSLRDYFAAKAMQGLLSADVGFSMSASSISEAAYAQADAMLAKGQKP